MPICFLEVPTGIHPDAKKKLVQKITTALNETWPIPDVRVFFREYQAEDVAQDGHFRSEPMKPICFLEVPLLRSLDAKRKLTQVIVDHPRQGWWVERIFLRDGGAREFAAPGSARTKAELHARAGR